ncbi:MAG: helix-turn-helix domain-containing protein [Oscillospiraceae bacterium]|nr:helix-turn-helix domain-containing protein [Oscillospiraceae bacterium]
MANSKNFERRDWFLTLLQNRGYTQSAFAVESEVSRQTLEKLISGIGMPSTAVAKKIELVLGVPAMWWENPPDNPMENLTPTDYVVTAERHVNSIGEIAVPAAFRRALSWEYGTKVMISLDLANNRVLIEKAQKSK